jgi:hypothetical protein
MKTYKDQSLIGWYSSTQQNNPSLEQIQTGALQRIADATELVAKNYNQLQSDMEWYKGLYEQERESNRRMVRRIAALQGVITKMKKKYK